MSSQALAVPAPARKATDTITIDFLFLDLTTCTRCVGTDHSLEDALGIVRDVLGATGTMVEVRKTLVGTAEQARELRLVSSPTIRVNGRDIAFELKETTCSSEACSCGDGQIACREWTYRGREYTEAPVGLIVDAVLGELYGGVARPRPDSPERYELPENLKSFFAGESRAPIEQGACCSPAEQASCCEPSTGVGCGCK
jgi:hypothetical protein